jgi:branched-chain amino acid transport system permease protein
LDGATLLQSIVNGLMAGSIYILVALGLTLLLSVMGIVQLAHGEIYMLGGYLTYYFCSVVGIHYLLALLIATLLVGGLGILIEKVFFRPFRHGDLSPTVILSLGLMLVLQTTAVVTFGGYTKVLTTPFPGVINIGGVIISQERLILILITAVFVGGLFFLLYKTEMGRTMRAVSQDMDAALLLGISVDRVSSFAMFLGCALAAVAGGLMGAIFSLSPFMGGFALMKGIAVIVLGGMGSVVGAVIGGLIIGLIDGIVPPLLTTEMASTIGFLVIILILLFRPQGIKGQPSR